MPETNPGHASQAINPEHTKALMALLNSCPYYQLLGMELREVGVGYAKLVAHMRPEHLNPMGSVHGGAYSSMLDTATIWSTYYELEEGAGLTTIDLSVNFLSAAREGLIYVEAHSIKVGRSICLAEAYARDENGKLLAQCVAKLMVLQGRSNLDTVVKRLGDGPLPPRYLD